MCYYLIVFQGGLGPRGDKGFPGLAGQQVTTMYILGLLIAAVLHGQTLATLAIRDGLRMLSTASD